MWESLLFRCFWGMFLTCILWHAWLLWIDFLCLLPFWISICCVARPQKHLLDEGLWLAHLTEMTEVAHPLVEADKLMDQLLTVTTLVNDLNKALDMIHDACFDVEDRLGRPPDAVLTEAREAIIRRIDCYKQEAEGIRAILLRHLPDLCGC